MYCRHCGNKLSEEGQFCGSCGKKNIDNQEVQNSPVTPQQSKGIAVSKKIIIRVAIILLAFISVGIFTFNKPLQAKFFDVKMMDYYPIQKGAISTIGGNLANGEYIELTFEHIGKDYVDGREVFKNLFSVEVQSDMYMTEYLYSTDTSDTIKRIGAINKNAYSGEEYSIEWYDEPNIMLPSSMKLNKSYEYRKDDDSVTTYTLKGFETVNSQWKTLKNTAVVEARYYNDGELTGIETIYMAKGIGIVEISYTGFYDGRIDEEYVLSYIGY